MEYLFNSQGQHIANQVGDQLHAPSGENIGHWLEKENIFIDMQGNYLGEIIQGNRLMHNTQSPHLDFNFGTRGDFGNAGTYRDPGRYPDIGTFEFWEDVDPDRLKAW